MRAIAVLVLVASLAVPVAAVAAPEGELVPGGSFDSGFAPWFATHDLAMVNDGGALCVDVPGGTPTAWSSLVGVDGVAVVSGQSYEFSFTATGETPAPVTIRALVQQPVDPWTATYEANPSIGGDETRFSYSFTAGLDLPQGQIVFQLGGAPAPWRFCLDDVHLAAGEPLPAYVPETGTRVRVNQVGYLADGPKRATLITDSAAAVPWTLRDGSGETVATGETSPRGDDPSAGAAVQLIDFSEVATSGDGFTLEADGETSYPFAIGSDLYSRLRYDALHYFALVRSGIAITEPGYERAAGHVGVAPNQGDTAVGCQQPEDFMDGYTCDYELDVSGGWYDAGDHGKYVVNGGIAVAQLLGTYERSLSAPSAISGALDDGTLVLPESDNDVPDILDEARWELEWMLRMQVPAGEELAGMVHHKVQDDGWTGLPLLPADDPSVRELHRPSTAATLNLAAVAAQGSRLFAAYDENFAATLLEAGRTAYAAALAMPDLYAPAADGNDGGGPYNDDRVADEFYWAAAELYLTTGEAEFEDAVLASPEHTADIFTAGGFNWADTAALGRMDLATVPNSLPELQAVRDSVIAGAERYLDDQAAQNFGQPFAPDGGYPWGSNGAILNNLVVLGTAYDLTGENRYRAGVLEGLDYILGRNAMNTSYVTGYGTVFSHNQHSRWFAHQLDPSLPQPPDGTLAGGPNSGIEDPLAQQTFAAGCAPQQCYLDDIQSYSTNELTINWNSALVWVSSFADDQREVSPASAVEPAAPLNLLPFAIGGGVLVVGLAVLLLRRRRRA